MYTKSKSLSKLNAYIAANGGSVYIGILMILSDILSFDIERSVVLACITLEASGGNNEEGSLGKKFQICPVIWIFVGCYLDALGYSNEEIRALCHELQRKLQKTVCFDEQNESMEPKNAGMNGQNESIAHKNAGVDGQNDSMYWHTGVINAICLFLREKQEEFEQHKAGRINKPKEYYTNIYTDRNQMFRHTSYTLEEQLVKAVREGDDRVAVKVLKEINSQGSKAVLSADPLRSAKNSVICTCVFLSRASIQAGVSPNAAFALSDAVICHIEEYKNRIEVLKYEEDVLLQFINVVQKNRKAKYSKTIQKAMNYIDFHLEEKIMLKDIAAYVGINKSYLSSRFNDEMSMSLTDYISTRKIQESTYFVAHKDYEIADIAMLYGFSGQSYYISVFKKVMGMTPGAYRARHDE
ncbi:AraC family transcriptional regulator [Lachnospiraceae bacterium ZAX-1]